MKPTTEEICKVLNHLDKYWISEKTTLKELVIIWNDLLEREKENDIKTN